MQNLTIVRAVHLLLSAAVLGSLPGSPLTAQTSLPGGGAQLKSVSSSPYHPSRFPLRAELHYKLVWGVDDLSVKLAESDELVRFSYHVLDPEKAKMLNDKKLEPSLIDPRAGVKLVIPELEKVGKLRQSSAPLQGRSYWMAFSNRGRLVKRGDRVIVVIGQFRAEGLVVD